MALTPLKLTEKFATDPATVPWNATAEKQFLLMSQDSGAGFSSVVATLEDLQSLISIGFSSLPSSGQNVGRMVYVADAFGSGQPGIAVFDSATTYKVFAPGQWDVGMFYPGTPAETVVTLQKIMVTRPITFAADFAGAYGHVGVNPGATYDIDVTSNGSSIGTVSITTGGTFTFTTVSNTAKNLAAGDRLAFVAPSGSPAEATIEDISFTIPASLRMTG